MKLPGMRMLLLSVAFGMLSQHALAQTNLLDRTLVIEYHNSVLDHYFLSTPPEAAIIDAGGAGPGWQRTGETFYVESLAYHPNGRKLCRFYGSVSPGPNSHFFTLDTTECDFLKQLQAQTPPDQPRWNYEGLAFPAGTPTNGQCLNFYYSKPVYRLYNNGFWRGVDSNHRFATRPEIVSQMVGRYWTLEGVAFCALP